MRPITLEFACSGKTASRCPQSSQLLPTLTAATWHMIGHLQSNKAGKAVELFGAVDSVDSVKLAEKLNSAARDQHKVIRVLLEINVGGEEAKSGLPPDSKELEDLLLSAPRFEALRVLGLMTVPPFTANPEGARPYFRKLCQIRDAIAKRKLRRLRWTFCPWACRTISKLPLKRAPLLSAWERQSLVSASDRCQLEWSAYDSCPQSTKSSTQSRSL